jgi:chorismate synthase
MSNTWGERLRLSIFGESHGKAIGIIIDGLPQGEAVDPVQIAAEMRRRAPGNSALSTARREEDSVELLSGLMDGFTTGAPVCGMIANTDARSRDYGTKLRPGHADLSAYLNYGGKMDLRGGGVFSGRLTAPLVFAGAVAKQILARRGVTAAARILSIGEISDPANPAPEQWRQLSGELPVCSPAIAEAMRREILGAKEQGDSLGGVIEAAAFGVPAGLGSPFFGSVESAVSSLLFSVPAVKGVEFGDGFRLARMRGSEANDPILLENGRLRTSSNHNGGILGGITNGMPLLVRAAIKPTPSIGLEQATVDTATMEETRLVVGGRHDPCIVPRAVPVIEACLALGLLDRILAEGAQPVNAL